MVRIAEIEAGSIAEELELRIGTRILRINGERVRDGIDLTFLLADSELEIETVAPDGAHLIYEVERGAGQDLGIVPAPDKIRECANECVFCFIDGNPPDVRQSLWLRDDDFRLSFTYGSYVTLTNLGPRGFQRLIDQRISPLYVSVHATEPDVRVRLLKNERAGLILEHLTRLLDAGLEVHTQVVLCPEWNDGQHLDRTMEELWALGPGILSLSIVPVGLTRYNLDRPVRLLRPEESARVLDQVDGMRARALAERGTGWCYGADELYLQSGRPLPGPDYYEGTLLVENGVGSVRALVDSFEAGLPRIQPGSTKKTLVLTGLSMGPVLAPLADRAVAAGSGAIEVRVVENAFYGEPTTVAGLLAGRDLIQAAPDAGDFDEVLLPADALNADDLFIDSTPLAEVHAAFAPARVRTGRDLMHLLLT